MAGVVKTVNGGADWQFSNAIKDNKEATLSGLNISKLDFDSQNHEVVYVGSYTGGLFKSEDSGGTWAKILSKIYVYDFAVHPVDPKTIYVAGYYDGKGRVLKTVDSGATWQEIYNEAGSENPVRAIALNQNSPNQLFIGTHSGNVIKSADGGNSWQLAQNFKDRINRIMWQSGGIYVLARGKGLFRSPNYAASFEDLSASLTGGSSLLDSVSSNSIEAFSQAFVDSVASGLIYLTTSEGLYKTTDDGKTWTKINLPVKSSESYARAIAIARNSSNIVYTSVGATVYKSVDAGANWQTQAIATNGFINYILVDPQLPQIAYAGIFVQE